MNHNSVLTKYLVVWYSRLITYIYGDSTYLILSKLYLLIVYPSVLALEVGESGNR